MNSIAAAATKGSAAVYREKGDSLRRRPTVGKVGLAEAVSADLGTSVLEASAMVQSLVAAITDRFHRKQCIELRGFGTFYPYHKGARPYKVPRMLEERRMPGRTTLKFKPSRSILLYDGPKVEDAGTPAIKKLKNKFMIGTVQSIIVHEGGAEKATKATHNQDHVVSRFPDGAGPAPGRGQTHRRLADP
jgi:nucleoid DNA-binding protein